MKIGLKRIDTQERITVKALLDSEVIRLVISLEFGKKQGFKLNIHYQIHRKRIEINVIGKQK